MSNVTENRPSWRNPLTLAAGGLLLVHMLLRYGPALRGASWPSNGGIDAIALGLAIIALIPWIATFLTGAKLPGGIEFAFRAVEQRQEVNERAVAQLRFIVDGFLTRDEYRHLLNIRENIAYEVKRDAAQALETELRRLRALGLIDGFGIRAFAVPDEKKRRIGDVFRLTRRGEEYLKMREENEAGRPRMEEEPQPEKNST